MERAVLRWTEFLILIKYGEDIWLLKRESLEEFKGLNKYVERLVVSLSTHGNGERTNPIDNSAILENGLGTHKDAVNLVHAEANAAVQDHFTRDA